MAKTVYANTERGEFWLDLVITDRDCGANQFARENKIPQGCVSSLPSKKTSDEILEKLRANSIDVAYLFYSRMLDGRLLDDYGNRLINFHPSLLPSHPGLHGFEDSVRSKSMLIGTTVHLVDGNMDTGPQILQSVTSARDESDLAKLRHRIFAQQCASLYQIHLWITQGDLTLAPFEISSRINKSMENGFCPALSEKALRLYERLLTQ